MGKTLVSTFKVNDDCGISNSIPGFSFTSPIFENSALSLKESSAFPLFVNLTTNELTVLTSIITGSDIGSTMSISALFTCKILILKFRLTLGNISKSISCNNGGDWSGIETFNHVDFVFSAWGIFRIFPFKLPCPSATHAQPCWITPAATRSISRDSSLVLEASSHDKSTPGTLLMCGGLIEIKFAINVNSMDLHKLSSSVPIHAVNVFDAMEPNSTSVGTETTALNSLLSPGESVIE